MKTTQIFKSILVASLLTISLFSCKEDPIDPIAEPLVLECTDLVADGASFTLVDRGVGVDYIINCMAVVRGDLTIDPNVTIQFGSDAGITVRETGSMRALASASSTILFTGEVKVSGSWKGLIYYSNDVKNELSFCKVEYAGSSPISNGVIGGIMIYANAKLSVDNCNIQFCDEYGINAQSTNVDIELVNNTISNCGLPMYIEAMSVHNISGGNYTNNTTDAIRVYCDGGSRAINETQTWLDLGVPFRIYNNLIIQDGKLTINPGVEMEFENGFGIIIGDSDPSTLIAIGTSSNPILFTSVVKSPGAWSGIAFNFTKSIENEIAFATIEYAGTTNNAGILMYAKPVLNVHDVIFDNISGCGFVALPVTTSAPNTNLTETNNTFTNVSSGPSC
jgi:hypothetical protein